MGITRNLGITSIRLLPTIFSYEKTGDKAKALRQAILITMKNNPEPIHWAAFTLVGEAE